MNTAERRIIRKMVARALSEALTVSVFDGEEWALKRSGNLDAILDALGATDSDTLLFRHADGERVGSIFLVYGNAPDEVVNDHTVSPLIERIVAAAD